MEQSQLANLVFDARNRKVLQRVCEHFQRSGLISSRRYKRSSLVIHNAFLGVELLTWVLNIGISNHRTDALILLELLLRAGLIDMIQEEKKSTRKSSHDSTTASPSATTTTVASPSSGSLRISDRSIFGDMKLQFALYRLRGDSSDVGKLSKSGWLHRVSRWRVTRKYYTWDCEEHKLAQWNSNKDESPSKIYYLGLGTGLGGTTIISALESQDTSASKNVTPRITATAAGAQTTLIDSTMSKFYFQIQFAPPQNGESSILLYAPTARDRSEWLRILWLSGCEYPNLSRAGSATSPNGVSGGSGDKKSSEVAPGSRPSPIHPSVLAPGHVLSSPIDAGQESDSEDEDEDEYDEEVMHEDLPLSVSENIEELTSASPPSASHSLTRSSPFPHPHHRRRLSFSERKHESDLMGIFSLKRAKMKFAIQAAMAKVVDFRRKNLERRAQVETEKAKQETEAATKTKTTAVAASEGDQQERVEIDPMKLANMPARSQLLTNSTFAATSFASSPSTVPLPSADGLDLNWMEFFVLDESEYDEVGGSGSGSGDGDVGGAGEASIADEQQNATTSSSDTKNEETSSSPVTVAYDNTEDGDSEDADADAGDDESESENDSDDDYDSTDEMDDLEGDAFDTDLGPILHPSELDTKTLNEPTASDLESMRFFLRRQRFQALSLSISQLMTPVAGMIAAPSSSPSSAANGLSTAHGNTPIVGTNHHPLTMLVYQFVRQFHDLYSVALEFDGGNRPHHTPSSVSSTTSSVTSSSSAYPPLSWPLASRMNDTVAVSNMATDGSTARRPRERMEVAQGAAYSDVATHATLTTPSTVGSAFSPSPSPSISSSPSSAAFLPLYPYPRHARAVLQAAKDDVRAFLSSVTTLLLDALRTCESELRRQSEMEWKRHHAASSSSASTTSTRSRRDKLKKDPNLRRIEREFLLLTRLVTQCVTHHIFQLIHRTLFPLYEATLLRKTSHLLSVIEQNRALTFKEMGLSEELISIGTIEDEKNHQHTEKEDQNGGTVISYQHASQ